jgi:hypothetical protein
MAVTSRPVGGGRADSVRDPAGQGASACFPQPLRALPDAEAAAGVHHERR